MSLPGWARDPLVHFLFGGFALFLLFAWRGEPADPASRSIDVDREQQAALTLQFERTAQRPPTDAELDALVESWVREEILYREALRLGLDQGDAVVRRRLANKMDILAASRVETANPADDTLKRWLEDHPERFAEDVRISFDQLWWEDENAAEAGLEKLAAGADWRAIGGSISLAPAVENERLALVRSRYGVAFADALIAQDANGEWSGPIASGFGWHAIRLRDRTAGQVQPLDQIRDRVEADWRAETARDRREAAYEELREAYSIQIAE